MVQAMPGRFASQLDELDPGRPLAGDRQVYGWTILEHIAHVRDELHVKANRLARLLSQDLPAVDVDQTGASSGSMVGDTLPAVLVGLALSADRFARLISGMTYDDRSRLGRRLGKPVTAWELVLEGTHEGYHHLTAIER
jgi:hypothetical protein